MKALQINELGDPWQKLELADLERPPAREGACVVKVEATDINFADILQCRGEYQVKLTPPFVPGMSAAGTVIESASGVALEPGQRIVGPAAENHGGFAEECTILAERAMLIPDGVDAVKAAAANVTYQTAWVGLHLRGNLQPGETVLVLAGAGGVGSAAIELAREHGCWIIAAAGTDEKVDVCRTLGADEVINYDTEDLYERVMKLTQGRGVDLIYDPVGGAYFDIARRLVAWEGRILVIGFAAGSIPLAPMNHVLVKNYSIVGVHMGGYRDHDPRPFTRCNEVLNELMVRGRISPLIDEVVGFGGLPDALRKLANRQSIGRLVFCPGA